MSTNRVPPSFPQPFDAAGTPEQRSIAPAQVFAHPPDSVFAGNALGTSPDSLYWYQQSFHVQSYGSTPNFIPTVNAIPRRPSPHIPPYHLTQDPIRTSPAFPMPQVQGTRVPRPTTPPYPPPPMVQTTHTPGYLNNTQVSPGLYSSYPPQASHSPLQHESGVSGVAHNAPLFQRNQDDSDDEGYQAYQGSPAMHDGIMRAKGPPSYVAHGVPDTVRTTSCPRCRRPYPTGQTFCARCNC